MIVFGDIHPRDRDGDGLPTGTRIVAAPPQNLPDVEAVLERHSDDGEGFCAAGCNYHGICYPAGACQPAVDARERRRQLLAEREH